MAFNGFEYSIWLGWLTGTIFLKKPWGNLQYSWISFYTLYALLINSFTILLWMDFSLKAIEIIKCQSLTSKILNSTLVLGSLLFGLVFKLFFWTNSKNIAHFVEEMKIYSGNEAESPSRLISSDLKRLWRKCKTFLIVCTLYQLGATLVIPVFIYRIAPHFSLYNIIPSPYYNVIFYLFASFPTLTVVQVAFVYVVVATFHMLSVFENFFLDLQEQIKMKVNASQTGHSLTQFNNCNQHQDQFESRGPTLSSSSATSGVLLSPVLLTDGTRSICNQEQKRKLSSQTQQQIQQPRRPTHELTRQEIVKKIQKVKFICSQYDKSVSPLFLALIIRCVFSLIHSADAILFETSASDGDTEFQRLKKSFAWMHIFFEMSQLCLIFVGTCFHQKVARYKEEFAYSLFLLEQSQVKAELQEMWQLVRDWKWEITAWGIYTVDKPVFAGVVSAMMTYVVILFQVNLSDPGVPENSNCTHSIHQVLNS